VLSGAKTRVCDNGVFGDTANGPAGRAEKSWIERYGLDLPAIAFPGVTRLSPMILSSINGA
jgi:hypothetical protein